MLSSLVPGLRDLRSPLVAGSLILFAAYLIVWDRIEQDVTSAELDSSLANLNAWLGRSGWIVIGGVTAYLVGSVYVTTRGSIERYVAARLVKRVTTKEYLYDRPQTRLESIFAPFSRPSLRRLGQLAEGEHDVDLARRVAVDIIFGAGKRLLVASAPLFDEYDRLRAGAEFRDAVGLPAVVSLFIVSFRLEVGLAIEVGLLIAVVLLGAVLFVHARKLDREARSMYAHAVCDGVVSTASLDAPERSGRRRWLSEPS